MTGYVGRRPRRIIRTAHRGLEGGFRRGFWKVYRRMYGVHSGHMVPYDVRVVRGGEGWEKIWSSEANTSKTHEKEKVLRSKTQSLCLTILRRLEIKI